MVGSQAANTTHPPIRHGKAPLSGAFLLNGSGIMHPPALKTHQMPLGIGNEENTGKIRPSFHICFIEAGYTKQMEHMAFTVAIWVASFAASLSYEVFMTAWSTRPAYGKVRI